MAIAKGGTGRSDKAWQSAPRACVCACEALPEGAADLFEVSQSEALRDRDSVNQPEIKLIINLTGFVFRRLSPLNSHLFDFPRFPPNLV